MPETSLAEFTETTEPFEDSMRGKYLSFILSDEVYAIEIKNVKEIIGIQPITQIPELPGYMLGIINLRGKIIPIMNVRLRLKKENREFDDRTCTIVVEVSGSLVGLIVDQVSEVLTIEDDQIVPPPDSGGHGSSNYLSGIGKVNESVRLILNCEKLIGEEEKSLIPHQI